MRLAITMPTGKIGQKLVDELLDRGGHDLVLLTRRRERVAEAVDRGALAFEGMLENRDFFTRATAKVDALFLVVPLDSRSRDLSRDCSKIVDSAVHAIETNDIQRVVFVSSIGAHLDKGTGPILFLRQAEQKLEKVVPHLTVLRPAFFMDQVMGWMKPIADDREFYSALPASTAMPMIATRDVATFAADVLLDTRWSGRRVIPLHGPREYSFGDAARILGDTLGMEIRHVELEPKKAADKLRLRGWSQEAVDRALEMQRTLALGKLKEELPRSKWQVRPTTFEQFARLEFQPAFDRVAAVTAGGV